MEKSQQPSSFSKVACIGSGISAIAVGATLKRWYGITDVCFFERHNHLGGTWFINQYPGIYSFHPNSTGPKTLASQRQLWGYLNDVAEEYDLTSKIRFKSTVKRCEWVESIRRWRIHVLNGVTGDVFVHECQFLFSGTGQLTEPRKPDKPGIETFKGTVIYACRWKQDADLRNKNVVVVGNGCTATQIVPAISPQAKHLTQFVRSKHWVLPPLTIPFLPLFTFLSRWIPGFLVLFRFLVFLLTENNVRGLYDTESAALYRERRRKQAESYMRKTAPEEYHDILIPDFEFGCKRRIFDSGYLDALNYTNVSLTNNPIVEFVPEGVRTEQGITKADVIVLANGYSTNNYLPGVEVIGRGGQTAEEHWQKMGGPGAYNTTLLSGFPNFFMVLGPNTLSGHTSAFMAVENSVNYSLRVMEPVLKGVADAVDVKHDAELDYVDDMQKASKRTVFMSGGCSTWYTQTKDGEKPRNAMVYPYSQAWFWYQCLFPHYKDLDYLN
ncbi:hypothetical protein CDD83_3625 [Cordyceps sp. RAO-2017]|nr:hypothetical protein CDD83_3625 [Cordyceps sp. RAO-2017]